MDIKQATQRFLEEVIKETSIYPHQLFGKGLYIKETDQFYKLVNNKIYLEQYEYFYAKIDKQTGEIFTPYGKKAISNVLNIYNGFEVIGPIQILQNKKHIQEKISKMI